MALSSQEKAIVQAYAPLVGRLLKSIRTSAEPQISRVGKFSWEGREYTATTTVEKNSGGYQIIVELRAVRGPVRALTIAEAQVLTSELDKAVVAAGWTVTSNYPMSALSGFGRRVAPSA